MNNLLHIQLSNNNMMFRLCKKKKKKKNKFSIGMSLFFKKDNQLKENKIKNVI